MAQGTFVPTSQLPTEPNARGGNCKQVALGTNTGAVYILYNLAVSWKKKYKNYEEIQFGFQEILKKTTQQQNYR
jgi:hypothetical protein